MNRVRWSPPQKGPHHTLDQGVVKGRPERERERAGRDIEIRGTPSYDEVWAGQLTLWGRCDE